jgi:16S rRNA (uracil1498-N3)-methyltransferase
MKSPRDISSQRLYLRALLAAGAEVALERGQANYLVNVLRLPAGAEVRVFNGVDGEWRAELVAEGKKSHKLLVKSQTRAQPAAPDLHYLFAPLKHARLDYMVEKATEMGAGRLRPVLTQHTQATRLNLERMEANAIEAAEQCGILSIPTIDEPQPLATVLGGWATAEGSRRIIFCDEAGAGADPVSILSALPRSPIAVLIGPEGGFSAAERERLQALPFVTAIPLGPRIMRADTAAIAALALIQAILGDWRNEPPRPYSPAKQ